MSSDDRKYEHPVPQQPFDLASIMIDGLCWRKEWAFPHEGGLSLLWKLIVANGLTLKDVGSVLKRNVLPGNPAAIHGRSFLSTRWVSLGRKMHPYFDGLFFEAGLNFLSQEWLGAIADDQAIRYCPSCMDQAFHSSLFQIHGLIRCPIHDEPLQSLCIHCSNPVGRYAWTAKNVDSPFCCAHCQMPLGHRYRPASIKDFVSPIDTSSLDKISALVFKLRDSKVRWFDHEIWHYEEWGGKENKRAAVFSKLRNLLSSELPDRYFSEDKVRTYEAQQGATFKPVSRGKIYERLRKMVERVLEKHHSTVCRDETRDALCTQAEMLYADSIVCPLWFGYYLWRHHFEDRSGHSFLRPAIETWPCETEVSNRSWRVFCIWSLIAYLDIANRWCGLVKELGGKLTHESMMEALNTLGREMNPVWRSWPSCISFIRISGSGGQRYFLMSSCQASSLMRCLRDGCYSSCPH